MRSGTNRWYRGALAVIAMAVASIAPSSYAAPTVDQSNLAPTASTGLAITGGDIFGQTVQVGQTGYLTRVDVSLAKTPGLTGDLFFQLLGLDSSGQPDELQVLAHRVINIDQVPDDQGLSIPLPFPVAFDTTADLIWMNAGDQFAIAVSRFAPSAPPWVTMRTTSASGGYTAGTLYKREFGYDEPWSDSVGQLYDAGFRTWIDAVPLLPQTNTVERRPVFDATATREPFSSVWTVTDGENGTAVQNFGNAADEIRTIMEFELPRLPDGAVVTGARLNLDMGGGSGSPSITAHAYAGNGELDVTDALQLNNPFFSSGAASPVGDRVIELSAAVIESAYAQELDFLGFLLRVDNGFHSGGITSLERNLFSISDGVDLPALEIDFELVSLTGDLNNDGFVGQDDLNIILTKWGQSVTPGDPLQGDPTGDGFVGQDDLSKVLTDWGQGTPPSLTLIPEPATGAVALLLCAGCIARTRRPRLA